VKPTGFPRWEPTELSSWSNDFASVVVCPTRRSATSAESQKRRVASSSICIKRRPPKSPDAETPASSCRVSNLRDPQLWRTCPRDTSESPGLTEEICAPLRLEKGSFVRSSSKSRRSWWRFWRRNKPPKKPPPPPRKEAKRRRNPPRPRNKHCVGFLPLFFLLGSLVASHLMWHIQILKIPFLIKKSFHHFVFFFLYTGWGKLRGFWLFLNFFMTIQILNRKKS